MTGLLITISSGLLSLAGGVLCLRKQIKRTANIYTYLNRPVKRVREFPQYNSIVATHTDCPEVLIWDIEAQPNRHAVFGAAESHPDLVLTGHEDNAEYALEMSPTEPYVLSGGKDKIVNLWSLQDHMAAASGGSIITAENFSIAPQGIFKGHEDTDEIS